MHGAACENLRLTLGMHVLVTFADLRAHASDGFRGNTSGSILQTSELGYVNAQVLLVVLPQP